MQFLEPIYSSLYIVFLFIWFLIGILIGYTIVKKRKKLKRPDLHILASSFVAAIVVIYLPLGALSWLMAFLVILVWFKFLLDFSWEKAILLALIGVIVAYVLDMVVGILIAALPI
ncbi:MAG: hypothetical protein ACTSW4_00610 [Candidatus Ranarchaeia archaeon]